MAKAVFKMFSVQKSASSKLPQRTDDLHKLSTLFHAPHPIFCHTAALKQTLKESVKPKSEADYLYYHAFKIDYLNSEGGRCGFREKDKLLN